MHIEVLILINNEGTGKMPKLNERYDSQIKYSIPK